jgi:hypothetical protein
VSVCQPIAVRLWPTSDAVTPDRGIDVGGGSCSARDVRGEHREKMPLADDKETVKALTANGTDPAFRERVRSRRPRLGLENPDAGNGEHIVKGPRCGRQVCLLVPGKSTRARFSGRRGRYQRRLHRFRCDRHRAAGDCSDSSIIGLQTAHQPSRDLPAVDYLAIRAQAAHQTPSLPNGTRPVTYTYFRPAGVYLILTPLGR